MTRLTSLLSPLLDFALPPRCPGCGEVTLEDLSFCAACWQKLHFLGSDGCVTCGIPLPVADQTCGAALAYGPIARRVILRFKYGGQTGLAQVIARQMARLVRDDEHAILVPVPLHRWRIWQRGFNQSALIARVLADQTGFELGVDMLSRTKRTPPLRGLNPEQRRRTVAGVFQVPPDRRRHLAGKSVLLVDDVYTTGATAAACAKKLKQAGAARVAILCWARVLPDSAVNH
jgi:ComF family protein